MTDAGGAITLPFPFKFRSENIEYLADAKPDRDPSRRCALCSFSGTLVLGGGGRQLAFGLYNAVKSGGTPPSADQAYPLIHVDRVAADHPSRGTLMAKPKLLQTTSQVVWTKSAAAESVGSEPTVESDCLTLYIGELDFLARSLRKLGIGASDSDDVLQDIFVVMMRRWSAYDRARPIRPWLFGIALRVATARRRRSSRESSSDEFDAEDPALHPDDAAAAAEHRTLLLRALEAVPLERRTVLIMHDVREMAMRDIAEELSIGLFAGYSRLRKARRELQALFTTLLEGESLAR